MAHEAVGDCFDESWTAAVPRLLDGLARDLPDLDGIIAVNGYTPHPVADGSVSDVGVDLVVGNGGVFAIEVVLAHEDHRQLPQLGQIE